MTSPVFRLAIIYYICLCIQILAICPCALPERPFVVIVPSFNNKSWYKKNLDSIWSQQYHNFRVLYVDDSSIDGTADLVSEYIDSHPAHFPVVLIRNSERIGPLANTYYTVHTCADYEIILVCDGDDFLENPHVLSTLNQAYKLRPDLMLTYGHFINYVNPQVGNQWSKRYSKAVEQYNQYRQSVWVAGQPRSFYAGLFKKIKKKDFMRGDDFLEGCTDVATMIPMLEMSGGRYECLSDVIYIYNNANRMSERFIRPDDTKKNIAYLRALPSYFALTDEQMCNIIHAPACSKKWHNKPYYGDAADHYA